MQQTIAHCASALAGVAHVICGDLNTFQREDMSSAAWEQICAHYASAGWPPPPQESLVLSSLRAEGYHDAFECWRDSAAGGGGDDSLHAPVTCWSQKPLFRLDYVMLSPRPSSMDAASRATDERACVGESWMRILGHHTLESPVSDHHPVVVELELRPPTPA